MYGVAAAVTRSLCCLQLVMRKIWKYSRMLYNHPEYRNTVIVPYIVGLILTIEVLREHKPPPNVSLIELWQFFPDPDGDADRHQN